MSKFITPLRNHFGDFNNANTHKSYSDMSVLIKKCTTKVALSRWSSILQQRRHQKDSVCLYLKVIKISGES